MPAFIAVLALLLSASSTSAAPPSDRNAPKRLADSAWVHLNRYVGSRFARRCLSRGALEGYLEHTNPRDSTSAAGWQFYYDLNVPEAPWVNGQVTVAVDLHGHLTQKYDQSHQFNQFAAITGIGNCARNPALCRFPINREDAIRIARRNGLEEGLRQWDVGFTWYYSQDGRFQWNVSNTLELDKDQCSGAGNIISIDANTGRIVMRSGWTSICCH